MQQFNTLVIAQNGGASLNSFILELDYRCAGLQALYEANMAPENKPHPGYKEVALEFVSRGGQIHYVIDADNRVLGSAYILGTRSLLQNLYPVERFFVEADLDQKSRRAVAEALLGSIVTRAVEAVTKRLDSIWVQVLFPQGSHEHPEIQPIAAALDANGFRGMSISHADLWILLIPNASVT